MSLEIAAWAETHEYDFDKLGGSVGNLAGAPDNRAIAARWERY
jgi:hypothetical protein